MSINKGKKSLLLRLGYESPFGENSLFNYEKHGYWVEEESLGWITHTVKEGETLWSISQKYKKYGVTVEKIKKWNKLPNNDIKEGQKLRIFKKQENTSNTITHTVKEDETLWSISQKYKEYGVTIDKIKKWNKLPNNDIKEGQRLTIKKEKQTNNVPQNTNVPQPVNNASSVELDAQKMKALFPKISPNTVCTLYQFVC